MNKRLKQLIERAEQYNSQLLDDLLIIPSGKAYNGFWGKNGYNKIILLGRNTKKYKVYRIDTEFQHDVISFDHLSENTSIKIDIPQEYNCIRLFSNDYFRVENDVSVLVVRTEEK